METLNNTILIIEDDLGLLELISEKIIECGFQTHCATSSKDAINWLSEHTPSLMIVDYNLSDSTAKDFVDYFYENELSLPPFLISTGQGDERIAVEMMKLGARDYIIKDANLLDLLPTIVNRVVKEIKIEHKLLTAQNDLLLTKQTYIDIFNTVTEAIYIIDENGTFIDVNEGTEKMYLRDKEYFIGKTPKNLSAEGYNDLQDIEHKLTSVLKTGKPVNFEFWAVRGNGEIFPKDVNVNKGKYFHKTVLIATARDISERKKAEAVFKDIIEKNPISIQILDMDGYTIQTNTAHFKLFGSKIPAGYSLFNDEQLLKQGLGGLFEKMKQGEVVYFPDSIFNVHNVNKSYPNKNVWIKATGFALLNNNGAPEKLVLMHEDITLRKQSEKALHDSEELYRNLVYRIPDGVYKSTKEGKFIDVNPAFVSMLGYNNKEELMAIDIKRDLYFDKEDRKSQVLSENHEELGVFRLKKKDGTSIWVEDNGWYNTDDKGNVIEHEGVLRNITERKYAEDALKENQIKLKNTLVKSSELIDINDESNHYQRIADAMLDISGAKYLSLSIFELDMQEVTTVATSGVKDHISKLSSYLGFEVKNKKWKYNQEEEIYFKENLTLIPSFTEAFKFYVPNTICKMLTKVYDLGEVAFVKIQKNNTRIGKFALVYEKGQTIKNTDLVELFANQTALFLERKKAEEELNKRMEELMRFHRLTVGRELTMIELKKAA